jgi:hypothetical protein
MSLESWTAHQTALGLHRYGAPLSASGLTVAQLLQHAACEAADLVAYLSAAADGSNDPDILAAHFDACILARHVCQLAGPAPEFVAAPQVPDADAVAKYGRYWWRRDEVVKVTIYRGSEIWYGPAGVAWSALVDPSDDWSGPVVARRRSVLPVAP